MMNARNVGAKVIVSLVAVGSLGIVGAGPLSGAAADAATQTTVTAPASGSSTTTTTGHAQRSAPQQACRQHRHDLGYLAKAHSHAAARIAKLKARAAKAEKAGHTKLAQYWQRSATHRAATLAREQAHLSKRTAAVAKRNTKLGVSC